MQYEYLNTGVELTLVRKLASYDNMSTLILAILAENKEFIAHTACHRIANKLWSGYVQPDDEAVLFMEVIL